MTDGTAKQLTKAVNRLAKVQEETLEHSKQTMKELKEAGKELVKKIEHELQAHL